MMQGTAFAGWGEKEGPRGGSPRSTMDDLFENSPAEYSMEYFFDELESVAEEEEGGRSGGTPSASQPGTQTLAEAVEAILSIERILHAMQYVELTDLRTLRKTLALAHVKLTTFAPQHLAAAKRAYEVAGRPVPALLDVLVGQVPVLLALEAAQATVQRVGLCTRGSRLSHDAPHRVTRGPTQGTRGCGVA